jgi:hypothetical protein
MQAPENFEILGSRGFYRPVGIVMFEQAVEMVAVAIAHARGRGLTDLLASTLGLTGFQPPSTFALAWLDAPIQVTA